VSEEILFGIPGTVNQTTSCSHKLSNKLVQQTHWSDTVVLKSNLFSGACN